MFPKRLPLPAVKHPIFPTGPETPTDLILVLQNGAGTPPVDVRDLQNAADTLIGGILETKTPPAP